MNNDDYIECSESILNFLLNYENEKIKYNTSNVSSNINMYEKLKKFNTNMVDFTETLNYKLCILENPLWLYSPSEFFSDNQKCIDFYIESIQILSRNKKIEKIINKHIKI